MADHAKIYQPDYGEAFVYITNSHGPRMSMAQSPSPADGDDGFEGKGRSARTYDSANGSRRDMSRMKKTLLSPCYGLAFLADGGRRG
jgi:hypothetical protein